MTEASASPSSLIGRGEHHQLAAVGVRMLLPVRVSPWRTRR